MNRNGEGLKVCVIIDAMQIDSDTSDSICQGELDLLMFEVIVLIGLAFTLFYIIFSFLVDYIGRKILMGEFAQLR